MNISLSPRIKSYWIDDLSYYSIQSIEKFINYFFNDININIINNSSNNYDGMIYDIQEINDDIPTSSIIV